MKEKQVRQSNTGDPHEVITGGRAQEDKTQGTSK